MENKEKTFKEIYISKTAVEKQVFEMRIANLCIKSPATIRQWAYGCRKPSALCKKLVSKELKLPITELFPEVVNEESR